MLQSSQWVFNISYESEQKFGYYTQWIIKSNFASVSQRQRWLKAAQAITQLLKLYLGDPKLVFTDSDFSGIWSIEQFELSDFKGILTQLRHISSLEFWRISWICRVSVYRMQLPKQYSCSILFFIWTIPNTTRTHPTNNPHSVSLWETSALS